MTVKDILVHIDHTESSAHRLDVAAQYAVTFDASVTGLHIQTPLNYAYYQASVNPEIVAEIETQRTQYEERSRALFEKYAKQVKSKSTFSAVAGNTTGQLVEHAAINDVAILGQSVETDEESGVPEKVALACGRPVIVIPSQYAAAPVNRHVLVAWNHKKEAVRAVHDAMPWLVAADSVKVLSVNSDKHARKHADIKPEDIGEHLERHGVNVEVDHIKAKENEIAECLLAFSNENNSSLLVMGAYGHSRAHELLLGGTTRTVLAEMDLPVFLSH